MKREAQFTLLFRHWVMAQDNLRSAAFELKQTASDSLPFDAVKDHQIAALMASKSAFLYKIPDDSRGIKPYDLVYLNKAEAFVVIRYVDCFVLIEVEDFTLERDTSKRKSLTSDRAKQIAIHVESLVPNKRIAFPKS